MKDKISILSKVLPRYGEILIAIGSIVSSNLAISENASAIEEIKKFLLDETHKIKTADNLVRSKRFQQIMCEYVGVNVGVKAIRNTLETEGMTNIYLFDFFSKSVWPIIVNRYIDVVKNQNVDVVEIDINVKKRVPIIIYGERKEQDFFMEFKQFLLDNYIVISKAVIKENGDMFVKMLVPVAC